MPDIRAGFISASYLFEVAQTIDLTYLKQHFGDRASSARLDDKAPGPARIQYLQAPLNVEGTAVGCRVDAHLRGAAEDPMDGLAGRPAAHACRAAVAVSLHRCERAD